MTTQELKTIFKKLLRNIFHYSEDRIDLDFGVYRVFRNRKDEIEKFIEENLPKFIENELNKESPKFEHEVYVYITDFFSAYYQNGDFYPLPVFSESSHEHIIKYNGKETMMWWANKDQYYIKSFKVYRTYKIDGEEIFKGTLFGGGKYKYLIFFVEKSDDPKGNVKTELNLTLKDVKKDNDEITVVFSDSKEKEEVSSTEVIEALKQKLNVDVHSDKLDYHLNRFKNIRKSDFFIHQNLKDFLEYEFAYYLKTRVVDIHNPDTLPIARIVEKVAKYIIEFISNLEDVQKFLWEKKKFVYDVQYVITLNRLNLNLIKEILKCKEIKEQIKEWQNLEMIDESFNKDNIIKNDLGGEKLNDDYKFLPLDTKYFKEEIKWKILESMDNIDDELDGILINSENWQALNTIMNRYKGKIQTIYIDPPFNKESEADYLYRVDYKDSCWITLLENRLKLSHKILSDDGSMFVRCDYNGNMYVKFLMDEIFGLDNFRNEIIIKRNQALPKTGDVNLVTETESLFVYSKTDDFSFSNTLIEKDEPTWVDLGTRPSDKAINPPRVIDGKEFYPPSFRRWSYSQENLDSMYKKGKLKLGNGKIKILLDKRRTGSNWTDIIGYSTVPTWGFKTENSEVLLQRVIEFTSYEGDIVMDFFLGSGTTIAVAHKLNRKWIGVEMGEHFHTIILPRMKKVLFYDPSGISKDNGVKEIYNKNNAGGFFKYFKLEQYEDTLENLVDINVDEEISKIESAKEYMHELYKTQFLDLLGTVIKNKSKAILRGIENETINEPFSYKLNLYQDDEKEKVMDLVETFNLWKGIKANKIFLREFKRKKYIFVIGDKEIIIWREFDLIDDAERKMEFIKEELEFFKEILGESLSEKTLYINGANTTYSRKIVKEILGTNDVKELLYEMRSVIYEKESSKS